MDGRRIMQISRRIRAMDSITDLERKADEAWMRQDFDAADDFAQQAHDKRKEK